MYIWQKQKSSMGGLFQKDTQEIKYMPHKITIEEANLLMNFFDMAALSKFDMYLRTFLGVSIEAESFLNWNLNRHWAINQYLHYFNNTKYIPK